MNALRKFDLSLVLLIVASAVLLWLVKVLNLPLWLGFFLGLGTGHLCARFSVWLARRKNFSPRPEGGHPVGANAADAEGRPAGGEELSEG